MLSMYVKRNQKDWDEVLPYVLLAYRTAMHSNTREVPAYLMFGRNLKMPSDISMAQESENQTVEGYKSDVQEKLKKAYEEVQYYNDLMKQKKKRNMNKERTNEEFKEKNLV